MTVINYIGLEYGTPYEIALAPSEEILENLIKLDSDQVEAIVQIGTNMVISPIVNRVENWIHKPVLTNNNVLYWYALCSEGVKDRNDCAGILFNYY